MLLVKIWKFNSYQEFMKAHIKSLPHKGRGFSVKIAEAIKVHPTLLSQILQGHRELTLEQASLFCDHLEMSDSESDFFMKLVELSRAGNNSLKRRVKRQLEALRVQYQEVKAHVSSAAKDLSEEEKSVFYSSWQYSAFRMLCSLEESPSFEKISSKLNLSNERARAIFEFLMTTGLIKEEKGRWNLGPSYTHVSAGSMWALRHHLNWRTRNLSKIENISKEELSFTAPFSCSIEDFEKIRESLLAVISETSQRVSKTTPEKAYSLCIDLMNI